MSEWTPAQIAAADQAHKEACDRVDELIAGVISPAVPCDCGEPVDSPGHIGNYARDFGRAHSHRELSVLLAEAITRLAFGQSPETPEATIRVCIDADCPGCGWPERWADAAPDLSEIKTFGCNKCEYRSQERDR